MKNDGKIDMEDSSIGILTNIKKWIKKNRSSKNIIIRFIIERIYFTATILYTIDHIFIDKEYRAMYYLIEFKSSHVQQITPLTAMYRYPVIFSTCSNYFFKIKYKNTFICLFNWGISVDSS